jgi:hypothetical protein
MFSILKPIVMPVLTLLVGKFITPTLMGHVIDIVFTELHAVVDKLPTHGVALSALETQVNKATLAQDLSDFLNANL